MPALKRGMLASLVPRGQCLGPLFAVADIDYHSLIGSNGNRPGPNDCAVPRHRYFMSSRRNNQFLLPYDVVIELVHVPDEVTCRLTV